jgi:hypothetical protein
LYRLTIAGIDRSDQYIHTDSSLVDEVDRWQ